MTHLVVGLLVGNYVKNIAKAFNFVQQIEGGFRVSTTNGHRKMKVWLRQKSFWKWIMVKAMEEEELSTGEGNAGLVSTSL